MESRATKPHPRLEVGTDGIGQIVFDDPDRLQNVLTEAVMNALDGLLAEVEGGARDGSIRALLVRSAKSQGFIAGADVDAIADVVDPEEGEAASRRGQEIFERLSSLSIPTVAAIHGVCLGGGTEMALACGHRVASDDEATRIGLPEVQLGILPGWGGSARLPRLIGLQAALDLMLTGSPARASKAQRVGLVDRVVPVEQFEGRCLDFVRALGAGESVVPKRTRSLAARFLDGTPPGRALVFRTARKRVMAQTGGHYPAPLAILDTVRQGIGKSLEEHLALEARALGRLVASPESKNLLLLFRLREKARRGPWAEGGVARPVEAVAVIGAGVMGGGIAQLAAYNDIPVRMKDIRHDAIGSGLAFARSIFDKAVKRRKLRRREASRKMGLISGGLDYAGLRSADLVIEAVVERLDVKKAVLAEVEGVVKPDAFLASNTSTLSIDAMAEALQRPERFLGMHFFNPVHRMPLVEVIRGTATSADAVETVASLAVRLGKVPVVTGDGPGFLVNRILGPYLNEAGHMLAEGWNAEQIDRAWRGFGMPMGPYRLMDEVGIDVVRHAGETLQDAFGARLEPAAPMVTLGASGRLGKKGGKGFYLYDGDEQKGFDATVYTDLGLPSQRNAPETVHVQDRLALVMVNEAARILAEGLVATAGDVDLAMIMGTGFPPFRGGLLKYADDRGTANVVEVLRGLTSALGPRFAPSDLLVQLADDGDTFHGAFPGTQ